MPSPIDFEQQQKLKLQGVSEIRGYSLQHFLLSPAAKTLSLVKVMRMSDEEASAAFRKVRWTETDVGVRLPCARLRPRLRRTDSPSSR